MEWIHMSADRERVRIYRRVRNQGAQQCGEHIPISTTESVCGCVCVCVSVLDIFLEEYTGNRSPSWQVGWGLGEGESHFIVYSLALFTTRVCYFYNNNNFKTSTPSLLVQCFPSLYQAASLAVIL